MNTLTDVLFLIAPVLAHTVPVGHGDGTAIFLYMLGYTLPMIFILFTTVVYAVVASYSDLPRAAVVFSTMLMFYWLYTLLISAA